MNADAFAAAILARLRSDAAGGWATNKSLEPMTRDEIMRLTDRDIQDMKAAEFEAWSNMVEAHIDEYEAIAEEMRGATARDLAQIDDGSADRLHVAHHLRDAIARRESRLAVWEALFSEGDEPFKALLERDDGRKAVRYWRAIIYIAARSEHPTGRFYWNRIYQPLSLWHEWKVGRSDLRYVS